MVLFFAATVTPGPLAPKPHYLGAEPDLSASSISGVRLSAINPGLNLLTEAAGQTPIVGGQGAATNLVARVECAQAVPGQALAHLAWTITSAGSEQRVDVTIFPDGFAAGHYESVGPLQPNQSSLTLDQLKGQAVHQWRVLTLRGGAWIASKTERFEGLTCVRDPTR
jgi:hypothetical protein